MNKQELIDYIKGQTEWPGNHHYSLINRAELISMIEQLDEPQITNEQAWNKIAEYYPETVQSLRITLDHAVYGQEAESQKVKVPAFVADWIEEVKQRGCGLADALDCFASPIMPDNIKEWVEFNSSAIGCHHDHQELLARAWLDGYEVEDEPKYRLVLPHISKMIEGNAITIHNMKTHETKDLAYDYFTESEIKSIDERYWPFAVPVEKV